MSESKRTPGPWTVEDRRHAALKNVRIVADYHPVAEVFDVHQRDYQGSFTGNHAAADAVDAVGLANAAFIVRAVNAHDDLLAALRSISDRASCAPHDDADEANKEFSRILLTARAAIAKAQGQ